MNHIQKLITNIISTPQNYLDTPSIQNISSFLYGYEIIEISISKILTKLNNDTKGPNSTDIETKLLLKNKTSYEAFKELCESILKESNNYKIEPNHDIETFFQKPNFKTIWVNKVGPHLIKRAGLVLKHHHIDCIYHQIKGHQEALKLLAPETYQFEKTVMTEYEKWIQSTYGEQDSNWLNIIKTFEKDDSKNIKKFIETWGLFSSSHTKNKHLNNWWIPSILP